jgi:hypothetical protein
VRVSTFQHTDKLYAAIRQYSRLVVTGTMPQVIRDWNPLRVETEAQAAVFEYLDALESLLLAVEEGAADQRIAQRYVQPILSNPQEMLETLSIYRARAGHVPEIYEVLERTLKRGQLTVLPQEGKDS